MGGSRGRPRGLRSDDPAGGTRRVKRSAGWSIDRTRRAWRRSRSRRAHASPEGALPRRDLARRDRSFDAREPAIEISEAVDGTFEQRVAAGASGLPLFQPLEVEQPPHRGIVVAHREQQLSKFPNQLARRIVENGEVTVVVLRGLVKRAQTAGRQRSLAREEQMIAVDHARSVDLAVDEGADRLALPSDVITMFSERQVVLDDLEVTTQLEARFCDVYQGDQRRLRRIRRADAHPSIA